MVHIPEMSDRWILRFQQLVVFAALSSLVVGVLRSQQSWSDYQRLNQSRSLLHNTIQELEQETLHLQKEIDHLRSSAAYAQKVLKDKYHKTAKAEEMILMHEPSS